MHKYVGCTLARRHAGVGTGIIAGNLEAQELGGVRGRYLAGASLQPQEHAIVVAIGRISIRGVVNAIPLRTLEGLMAHMALANTQWGENTMELGLHVCFRLGNSDVPKVDMLSLSSTPLSTCPSPAHSFLVKGGKTLRNGATVIPILVVFTDHSGRIASELFDVPISQGPRGPQVAAFGAW